MKLNFSESGLLPAIAQQYDSGEVLMLAWVNQEAIDATLAKKEVHYFSRSRQELWHKGATSGHIQHLKELRYDCDQDAVLFIVDQVGPACHTHRRSCFYHGYEEGKTTILLKPEDNA
jgi:phosphoribosyl-AMP cyclohydrolase